MVRYSVMEFIYTPNAAFITPGKKNHVILVLCNAQGTDFVSDFKRLQSVWEWLNVDDCCERKPGYSVLRGVTGINVGILFGMKNLHMTRVHYCFKRVKVKS